MSEQRYEPRIGPPPQRRRHFKVERRFFRAGQHFQFDWSLEDLLEERWAEGWEALSVQEKENGEFFILYRKLSRT